MLTVFALSNIDTLTLQHVLLEKFPRESGQNDPNERVIPFLPGVYICNTYSSVMGIKGCHTGIKIKLYHFLSQIQKETFTEMDTPF